MSPEISVVMACYNSERVLAQTIDSILAQDYSDFEFIIVDDGSYQPSKTILNRYRENDIRIKILEQTNLGITKALIKGCEAATGKYIARQDAGDISLSGRLKYQKDALDFDDKLSFVSCWTEFSGPEGEFLFFEKGMGRASSPINIINLQNNKGVVDGPTHHGSVMFRTDAYLKVGGYRREFYFGQDWDLWYRLSEFGKFQMIEKVLYRASVSPGSISGRYRNEQKRIADLSLGALRKRVEGFSDEKELRKAAEICKHDDPQDEKKALASWLYFIGECLRKNNDSRAGAYLKKAVLTNPLLLRSWIRLAQSFYK